MIVKPDGKVGIGTATPGYPLEVSSGTDNVPIMATSTDATCRINMRDSATTSGSHVGIGAVGDDLSLWAGNSKKVTVLSGGKVGIGTTSPVAGLDIATTAGDTWTTNGWDSGIMLNPGSMVRWGISSGYAWGIGNSGSTMYFATSTSDTTGAAAVYPLTITAPNSVVVNGSLAVTTNATITGQLNCSHIRGDETTQYFGPSTSWEMYLNTSGLYPYTNSGAALGSTSKFWNGVYSTNWFRSGGATGWYNETYSGGWYMQDTTYLRVYNNKQLYNTNLIRTDSTNAFRMANATGTGSYNTVRYRTTDGQLMPYTSTEVSKANITEMKGLLEYLNERSLLYSLRPVIFTEADDRLDRDGLPVKTSRDEYTHGMVAEEVLEVAPELAYFDYNGELMSYAPDLFVPDIIAELQRLMPMVEALYSAANADWVAPAPRTEASSMFERSKYDAAAEAQALIGFDNISDPIPNRAELDELDE
jgi:hypothetical protein